MYVVKLLVALGVPLTNPFAVLNVSPAGNAGSIAYVNVLYPPLALTGVTAVIAVFLVNEFAAASIVEFSAGSAFTVRLKVFALVCAGVLLSETVTVYVVCAMDCVAVPDISPVVAFNDKPLGSAGLIA